MYGHDLMLRAMDNKGEQSKNQVGGDGRSPISSCVPTGIPGYLSFYRTLESVYAAAILSPAAMLDVSHGGVSYSASISAKVPLDPM